MGGGWETGWAKEPSCKVEGLLQSPLLRPVPGFRPWSGQGVDQTVGPSREGLGEEALSVCV